MRSTMMVMMMNRWNDSNTVAVVTTRLVRVGPVHGLSCVRSRIPPVVFLSLA